VNQLLPIQFINVFSTVLPLQVGVVETDEDSYLIEPVVRNSGEGSPHIVYKVQWSPNIGGASGDGGIKP